MAVCVEEAEVCALEETAEQRKKRINLEATRRYREKNREAIRERNRKAYKEKPQKFIARYQKWYAENRDVPEVREKANALARKSYSKRSVRYKEAAAGRPKPELCEQCGKGGKICFDHDHETGKFRGWLCTHCNLLLGHAKDDPEILRKLASYLEESRGLR